MISKRIVFTMLISSILAEETVINSDLNDFRKSLSKNCAKSYTLTCLELDVVSWVDKLNEEDVYNVFPGVSLVHESNNNARTTTDDISGRDFPNEDARLDGLLLKKITDFLNTHSLKLSLWKSNEDVEKSRAGGYGGGGGKGKDKGSGMMYVLAAAAMMKATLGAIALKGLALIAGKAIMAALVSLTISTIIGLKSLTQGGPHSTSYEVIAKPTYTHANTHSVSHENYGHYGHSSYGRSLNMP